MDIFKNPFYILGATPRDDRHRITDIAEERSLLSDTDECMTAQSALIHPLRRISAEVTWLPGINPVLSNEVLGHLDSPNQNLLNITGLTHIARSNLLVSGLSRLSNLASSNLVEWILAIAQTSEAINSEVVCATLNADRRISGFPEITDLSMINDEIRKQRRYYSETLTSVLVNLSVNERARVMTSLLEISTNNGRYQCPILIKDLISGYELSVQDFLEKKKKIIEAQDQKLRAMVDAKNPDTTLAPIVDQLLESVKEWDTLAQPIQLSKKSTGQRHDASFEIVQRLRILAADLFGEYGKFDFSRNIINMLKEVFAEVPELIEYIREDAKALEEQIPHVKGIEKFKQINGHIEKLKEASDTHKPDYILTPIVNELIQTVKTWNTSTQPVEGNNTVAIAVRDIALHLWNEHQKLDFAIQITNALIGVFRGVYSMSEVNSSLNADIRTLSRIKNEQEQNRKSVEKFEEINAQTEKLKEAADAKRPDYALTPMVNQLIQTIKTWDTATQPIEANNAVAITVRNIALHLWNEHQKLDFAIQITNALIGVFRGVYGMDEVNNRLKEDIMTLYAMNIQRRRTIESQPDRKGTGCLLQIVIFIILALIVALSQGC